MTVLYGGHYVTETLGVQALARHLQDGKQTDPGRNQDENTRQTGGKWRYRYRIAQDPDERDQPPGECNPQHKRQV